jgi:hypothetical protein
MRFFLPVARKMCSRDGTCPDFIGTSPQGAEGGVAYVGYVACGLPVGRGVKAVGRRQQAIGGYGGCRMGACGPRAVVWPASSAGSGSCL